MLGAIHSRLCWVFPAGFRGKHSTDTGYCQALLWWPQAGQITDLTMGISYAFMDDSDGSTPYV